MAAGNFIVFSNALKAINDATIDLDTDTYRMVLVTSAWTPNQNTNAAWSDISANEVANGNGYTTHGKLLAVTTALAANVVTVDCDDQAWASSTITAKYAVIVRDANADGSLAAGDIPVAYVELEAGGTVSTTNGTLTVAINANGVFTMTAATS